MKTASAELSTISQRRSVDQGAPHCGIPRLLQRERVMPSCSAIHSHLTGHKLATRRVLPSLWRCQVHFDRFSTLANYINTSAVLEKSRRSLIAEILILRTLNSGRIIGRQCLRRWV